MVAAVALGIAPFAALMLAYQAKQFGGAFRSGYDVYASQFRPGEAGWLTVVSADFSLDGAVQWAHLQWFATLSAEYLTPFTATLVIFGLVSRAPRDATKRLPHLAIALSFLAQLAMVIPTRGDAGDEYGPRYLFALLGPGALLAAGGYSRIVTFLTRHAEWRKLAGVPAAALGTVLIVSGLRDAARIAYFHDRAWRDSSLHRSAERAGLRDAAVIIDSQSSPGRRARNGPTFDGPTLFLAAWNASPETVAEAFPRRKTYIARESGDWWSFTSVP
jgi:hypothetical protein